MAEYTDGDLTLDDLNYYQQQRSRLSESTKLGLEQNQWQRQIAGSEYQRGLGDLRTQFAALRDQLPHQFARGGLLNSGIYARALDRWQSERTRQTGNLYGRYQDQLGGLNLADQQLERIRANTAKQIDQSEVARRATVKALLGGV
jgi:hypothetical protein